MQKLSLSNSNPHFTVRHAGRDFVVAQQSDQAGFKGAITYEKRVLNELFAQYVLNSSSRVLDAYAGYGISTYSWLSTGANVLAVERSARNFECMRINLAEIPDDQLHIVRGNNLNIMPELAMREEKFDMIDLDPFGNAYRQIELSLPLIQKGYLWITSGEHVNFRRKLNRDVLAQRYGDAVEDFFERRKPVTAFPHVIATWVKTLRSEAKLVNFVMSPACLRMLFAVGCAVPRTFTRAWSARPKLFGGLEKLRA